MNSPDLVPYSSFIQIDRNTATPVYLQVVHQVINAIQRGFLSEGQKLPGSRRMGQLLELHRNTVVASYSELEAQGWIVIQASSGAYVRKGIRSKPVRWSAGEQLQLKEYPKKTGYAFKKWTLLDSPYDQSSARIHLDDGLPDFRLSHADYLSRLIHTNLRRKQNQSKLGYNSLSGNVYYRENLVNFLNLTRGLHISKHNILATRSQELSVYMVAETVLSAGDLVVVGELSYYATNMIFQKAGARIRTIPVDDQGIDVDALEVLCRKESIRMLYVASHHHYPTTTTLCASRRLALLSLASRYGFIILEDDYDYDFHYDGSPLLPIASADTDGMVIYVGTFGKSMASGFRSGFIVAPEPLIQEMSKLLDIMDRHGNVLTELTLGELIAEGEIHRYLKKMTKEYKERRDYMSTLLDKHLSSSVTYTLPSGGLAIWTEWKPPISLSKLSRLCADRDVYLPKYLLYQTQHVRGIRLGFGSVAKAEQEEVIPILADVLKELV